MKIRAVYLASLCALAALAMGCSKGPTQAVYVTGLIVRPPDTTLSMRASLQLHAFLVDAAGRPVVEVPASFASSDSSTAGVSADGLVTSRGPLGGVVLTASYGTFQAAARVRVLDSTIVASVTVPGRPFGAAANSGGIVYVTRLNADSLARFDLPSPAISAHVTVGSVPTSDAFSPNGTTAFVANQGSSDVGIITVATNTQATTLSLIGNPFIVRASPDGALVWVTTNAGGLYAIDLSTHSIVHSFTFPSASNGMVFHPTNDSLLYASVIDGTVKEINFKRDLVLRTLPIGSEAQGLAIAPDGSELYVADQAGYQLKIVSLSSGAVTSIVLPGQPFDVQLSPDGTMIWVGQYTAGQVQVFDRSTRALRRTIRTGGTPRRIAFNHAGTLAVIANEAGWVDFVK